MITVRDSSAGRDCRQRGRRRRAPDPLSGPIPCSPGTGSASGRTGREAHRAARRSGADSTLPGQIAHRRGFPAAAVGRTGWSIFDPDVPYPIAVMFASAIDHNSKTLVAYCSRRGVSFAPHGKTTMSPALFRRQIDDGAWAITAATTWQASVMRAPGVERVLIANQVVTPGEIEWLARAREEGFDVYCYVDSLAGVDILVETLGRVRPSRPFPVLLELGDRRRADRRPQRRRGFGGRASGCRIVAPGAHGDGRVRRDPRCGRRSRRRRRRRRVPRRDRRAHPRDRRGALVRADT